MGAYRRLRRSLTRAKIAAQDELSMLDCHLPDRQDNKITTIRPARAADVSALLAIEAEAFASDRLSERSFRALVAARSAALLVTEKVSISGYALVLFRKNSRAARLYSLAVRPGKSGRGFGAQLLAAAEREAARRGADRLRLEVRADNARALRFYRAHGYVLFGRKEHFYADGEAALRLQRDLVAPRRKPSAHNRAVNTVADG